MTAELYIGRRVPDGEFLTWRKEGKIEPGDYGVDWSTIAGTDEQVVDWFVCFPDGQVQFLRVREADQSGSHHVITDHDDGTITVDALIQTPDGPQIIPSADIHGGPLFSGKGWQGHLERGVWRPGRWMQGE